MATGTRASHRRPHVSSVPPSQGDGAASSGTTVPDEYIHTVNGRYVTPKTERPSSSRTDIPHFSQDCDDANAESREASQSTIADEALPLGEHMNEVISVVSKLEGLGLQRLQIPLPKCVVLGMYGNRNLIKSNLRRGAVHRQVVGHRGHLWHQDASVD